MFSILLAIIYVAFISLGLPDSLLGSAWPIMHTELDVPVSYAGIVTMIIAVGTIISSLQSDRLTKRLGTGLVTALSVGMTALALGGFSFSHSFLALCLWAVPYGLGAGAVDAALNNYVALHYAARHMSWLHCFWGVGASIGPFIMGAVLTRGQEWNQGFWIVGLIQAGLTLFLLLSLPLWKHQKVRGNEGEHRREPIPLKQAVRIPGVTFMLVAFFGYSSFEATATLWASSYLAQFRDVDAAMAARFGGLVLLGITGGRFLTGFVTDKIGDQKMIRMGVLAAFFGAACIALPLENNMVALIGLVIVGFGCAPIYPSIIHSTPANFGRENSQAIIGIQMASAYVGTTLMPPLFGVLASTFSMALFPIFLMLFMVLTFVMTERLNKRTR